MGLRPKVGRGQGSAKVILPAPVYWDYAKAGRSLDNLFWRSSLICPFGRLRTHDTRDHAPSGHAKTVFPLDKQRGVDHVSEAWAVYQGD